MHVIIGELRRQAQKIFRYCVCRHRSQTNETCASSSPNELKPRTAEWKLTKPQLIRESRLHEVFAGTTSLVVLRVGLPKQCSAFCAAIAQSQMMRFARLRVVQLGFGFGGCGCTRLCP